MVAVTFQFKVCLSAGGGGWMCADVLHADSEAHVVVSQWGVAEGAGHGGAAGRAPSRGSMTSFVSVHSSGALGPYAEGWRRRKGREKGCRRPASAGVCMVFCLSARRPTDRSDRTGIRRSWAVLVPGLWPYRLFAPLRSVRLSLATARDVQFAVRRRRAAAVGSLCSKLGVLSCRQGDVTTVSS